MIGGKYISRVCHRMGLELHYLPWVSNSTGSSTSSSLTSFHTLSVSRYLLTDCMQDKRDGCIISFIWTSTQLMRNILISTQIPAAMQLFFKNYLITAWKNVSRYDYILLKEKNINIYKHFVPDENLPLVHGDIQPFLLL